MKLDSVRLRELIGVARGGSPADLCLRNAQLVNVFSGRVHTVDLAVHAGLVVGWGDYAARRNLDLDGRYICPGFIDAHMHLESTLLSPAQFCAAVLPRGTTAVIADPHEIANVLGLPGIRYFLAATADLPLDVFFNLPSCVPACPLETSGAALRACDLHALLPHPQILGLAEMMNFPGVLHGDPEVLDKLVLFQDTMRDGHAPLLSGLPLNGYLVSGIGTDHECTSLAEAREKLEKGVTIMIRQGSQSHDLEKLVPLINQRSWPRCVLVSDDRHPDDLLREGHMDAVANRAMALGLDPVLALSLATWTAADTFRLPRRGALAPGYLADFSVSTTLNPWVVERVFKGGTEVARDGKLAVNPTAWPQPPAPESPMRISAISRDDLIVPLQPGNLRVIGVQEGTLLTTKILAPPKSVGGQVVADVERDILKLVVFNRYQPDRQPAVGFVQGFGLKQGAIASTVAHDAHNLITVGTNDEAIVQVADALRRSGGGMAVGDARGAVELLPLPIAGLMSDWPVGQVVERMEKLKDRARAWGSRLHNPFMALSFLALAVIPELKLTDLGLVDVSSFALVPLFDQD